MTLSQGLDYWLRNFPEFRREIMQKDQLAQNAQTEINQLKLINAEKEATIAHLTQQINDLQQQLNDRDLDLHKEKNKIVTVSLTNNEIWQKWHAFIDKTQIGYHEPLKYNSSTNIEIRYSSYTSDKKLVEQFRKQVQTELNKQKKHDLRFDKQETVIDILRQIVFSKM